jgi:hypothetical protein
MERIMSIAESDLSTNGNGSNGNSSNGNSSNGNGSSTSAASGSGTSSSSAAESGDSPAPSSVSTNQSSVSTNQSNDSTTSSNNSGDAKQLLEESPNNDCLAQAQVQMPWLNFNAKLHVKGSQKKKKNTDSSNQTTGFKLPGFSIKKNEKKGTDSKHGDKKIADSPDDDWTDPDLSVPKKKSSLSGFDGLSVWAVGIALPIFLLLATVTSIPKRLTLVILNHPLETMSEILLIIAIPFVNYFVWSAISKKQFRFSWWRGLALGAAIGTSFVTAGICIAAVFAGQKLQSEIGSEFGAGFIWIALLFLLTALSSCYLANRVRLNHDFAKSRMRILSITIAGAIMSVLTFVAAEARPWYIRLAEEKALSNVASERAEGWNLLRQLNPEKEMLMECSDSRAAGLSGLFLPIKTSTQHQLYFALTGKPYSFKDIANTDLSSMPDDYLSRHVVGEKIPGLSMTRSSITGLLHPNSLSSTLDWTFVFKNQGQSAQEARAEIGLPPGAVATSLTLWNKGEPEEASFAASGKAEKYVTSSSTAGHDSPAIITDLGHGRMLLHCYPVRDAEELKVRVRIVMPLKPDGDRGATLAMPRLIAENFEIGDEHQIRLRSSERMNSTSKSLTKGINPDGTQAISGSLSKDQIENANVIVTVQRNEMAKPVVVLDKLAIEFRKEDERRKALLEEQKRHTRAHRLDREVLSVSIDGSRSIQKQFEELTNALEKRAAGSHGSAKKKTQIKAVKPEYVIENVNKIAAPAPKNLLIVIDGSTTVKENRADLLKALNNIPQNVPTKIVIASADDKVPVAIPLQQGLEQLASESFIGGHDNLKSVVRASELAGETERGAVLWIHGPQPVLNQEIYIMAPFLSAPTFYELPLGAGDTDAYDFFKNHSEIGPFLQVPRSSMSVKEDLSDFFSKWKANANGYEVSLTQSSDKPDKAYVASSDEGRELLALHANQKVKELVLARHIRKSARIAVAYGLVTPVSCALVPEVNNNDTDIDDAALASRSNQQQSDGNALGMFANAIPGSVPSESSGASSGTVGTISAQGMSEAQLATMTPSGASNGTIGPQGYDATYVTGVNTAGTVRVNNLANLEALLNIVANLWEVGLMIGGAIIFLNAFVTESLSMEVLGQEIELSRSQRIAIAIGVFLLGLAFPGLVNWFVASARDANLFS